MNRAQLAQQASLNVEHKAMRGSLDVHDVTASALVDVELLTDADAHVGALTSNVFRLVLQLSFARKGYVAPFVSLENTYCSNFGAGAMMNRTDGTERFFLC
mmetsp:Transcript_43991/g.108013  ORF Transcript_43991/g.108013 Transcript_43991/m.108013 type:complete len:101 (+) Transcript_43991:173-475(+)